MPASPPPTWRPTWRPAEDRRRAARCPAWPLGLRCAARKLGKRPCASRARVFPVSASYCARIRHHDPPVDALRVMPHASSVMRPGRIMRFDMDGLCTWRQGDECSIPTAPVKTKRSWNVPSEASSKAFGWFTSFSPLFFFLSVRDDRRHESLQWHVDVGQGATSSSPWGRARLRKRQARLFEGASICTLERGTSGTGGSTLPSPGRIGGGGGGVPTVHSVP